MQVPKALPKSCPSCEGSPEPSLGLREPEVSLGAAGEAGRAGWESTSCVLICHNPHCCTVFPMLGCWPCLCASSVLRYLPASGVPQPTPIIKNRNQQQKAQGGVNHCCSFPQSCQKASLEL